MEKSNNLQILIAVVVILGFFAIIYFRNMRIENEHEIKVRDKFDKWSPKKLRLLLNIKELNCNQSPIVSKVLLNGLLK